MNACIVGVLPEVLVCAHAFLAALFIAAQHLALATMMSNGLVAAASALRRAAVQVVIVPVQ